MKYNFDEVIDRRSSECAKWNDYDADVIPLPVADMDFVSSQAVIQALQERVAHGVFGYPQWGQPKSSLMVGLYEVILERLERLYGWKVPMEALAFIPGVVPGLNLACYTLAGSRQGILIQTPVYQPFLSLARNNKGLRQDAGLEIGAEGRYQINWDIFTKAITSQTKAFVLCNPHNPVGRVFQRDELEQMAQISLKNGVTIISDEIHCDLLYKGQRHIPIASLDDEIAQNSITLMAPSKTFNLAGLNCAFAIIPNPELRKRFYHSQEGRTGGVNLLGLTATEAAYRHGQEWLDQLLAYLEGNRDYLMKFVEHELPGVRAYPPEGTYLAWLDCRSLELPVPPGEYFLKNARVALTEGKSYGPGGEGFVRVNFGCPRVTLARALERIRRSIVN